MERKRTVILSISAALAALGLPPAFAATEQSADDTGTATPGSAVTPPFSRDEVNQIVRVGDDFMGFVVSQSADGTVVAGHYSHTSHASHQSHQSHQSHYSSRF